MYLFYVDECFACLCIYVPFMRAGAGVGQERAPGPREPGFEYPGTGVTDGCESWWSEEQGTMCCPIHFPQVSNFSALNVIVFSSALAHLSFCTFFLAFCFVFKSKIILEHFKR